MESETPIYVHPDGRIEIHPLFNPAIFPYVRNHLDVEDLKQTRLVCKQWCDFIVPALEENAWVNIGLYNGYMFETFLDFVASTEFKYKNFNFDSSSWLWNHENLEKFFNVCGKNLRSLKLTNTVLPAESFRKILLFRQASSLENLIFDSSYFTDFDAERDEIIADAEPPPSLHLKSFTYINRDPETEFTTGKLLPFTWNELFTHFPLLDELTLIDLREEMRAAFFTSFLKYRKRVELKKLNIFGESDYSTLTIQDYEWTVLRRLNLHLETLIIDIGCIVQEEQLAALLRQLSPTLRTLRIWRGTGSKRLRGFPYQIMFRQLENLEIEENCIENLDFLNLMPKLESLWIRICDNDPWEDYTTLLTDIATVRPRKYFRTFRIDSYLTVPDLENLAMIFPNLCELVYFKEYFYNETPSENDIKDNPKVSQKERAWAWK